MTAITITTIAVVLIRDSLPRVLEQAFRMERGAKPLPSARGRRIVVLV